MDILLKNMLYLIDSKYQKDEDFEKEFGIAKTTVSAWRRGTLKSYDKYAARFAVFFDVSLDWLYGLKQKNKPSPEKDSLSEIQKELLNLFDLLTPDQQGSLLSLARSIAAERRSKGM
jgi:hypothetical protein